MQIDGPATIGDTVSASVKSVFVSILLPVNVRVLFDSAVQSSPAAARSLLYRTCTTGIIKKIVSISFTEDTLANDWAGQIAH